MVKNNQSVIMMDNSPVCVLDGQIGVMLPFYGSSSFVNEALFDIGNEGEKEGVVGSTGNPLSRMDQLFEKVKQGEEEVMKMIEEMAESTELFVYVMYVFV